MINLLDETQKVLKSYNYTWEDIDWIGGCDFSISIDNFREVAMDAEYASGYGAQEVADDLLIVMKDKTWFSRREYDGSEWWAYHKLPRKPEREEYISALTVVQANPSLKGYVHRGWETLAEINDTE